MAHKDITWKIPSPDDGTEIHHMENPDDERHHMENPNDAPQKRTKKMKKIEAKE